MTATPAVPARTGPPVVRVDDAFLAEPTLEETSRHVASRCTLALTRLCLGWMFLWGFLDKLFGLGHETASKAAWVKGGSPTAGLLGKATEGPFASFYQGIAGAPWVNWSFMAALAAVGAALVLGVAMRAAAAGRATLLMMMWTAVLPPADNPFMDDHVIYALVLIVLALAGAGRTLGLGRAWERIPLVVKHGALR